MTTANQPEPNLKSSSQATLRDLQEACGIHELIALVKLSDKDGVEVYRAQADGRQVIIKLFKNPVYCREIEAYLLLQQLGIHTLELLGHSAAGLVLEDLQDHPTLRLGREEDLSDPAVMHALAQWYAKLHEQGQHYAGLSNWQRETDAITAENLKRLGEALPETAQICEKVTAYLPDLHQGLNALHDTLTYNDFYWTNLAVSHDKSSALMFDYNLLGRGCRHGDLRNVCSSLHDDAAQAFMQAYAQASPQPLDPTEQRWDKVAAPLVTLIEALKHPQLPQWAQESKTYVTSGAIVEDLQNALQFKKGNN